MRGESAGSMQAPGIQQARACAEASEFRSDHASKPKAEPESCTARRILIVEDNLDGRETLRLVLQLLGHRVEVAETGPDGLRKGLAWEPDIALIDIGLPFLDGYQVARQLRQALGDKVYLIAYTGYGQPEDRRRAFEAGFDLHLTKPVDPRQLFQFISWPGQPAFLDRVHHSTGNRATRNAEPASRSWPESMAERFPARSEP